MSDVFMVRKLGMLASLTSVVFCCGNFCNSAQIYNISFETEDDFLTPLVNGQSVYSSARPDNANPSVPFSTDTRLEFGRLISISSTNLGSDGNLGPAIFDSDPADAPVGSNLDDDLRVGLGNVLILHRDEGPNTTLDPTYGLRFNNPNDEATSDDGGSIVVDFLITNVRPVSIDLVDIDDQVNLNVILTDNLGRNRTYTVPSNWTTDIDDDGPSGFQTLSLETLLSQPAEPNTTGADATATQDMGFDSAHVVRLEAQFLGDRISGAIDNLVFGVPEPNSLIGVVLAAAVAYFRHRLRKSI
jgi:hypothetical protein